MELIIIVLTLLGLLYLLRRWRSSPSLDIRIANTPHECDALIDEIYRRCKQEQSSAVGFDCEWVGNGGRRQPVALLQLSTYDGLVGLFHISKWRDYGAPVTPRLKLFLGDFNIMKVGVAPIDDAKYLLSDYGAIVKSTLDIRHIVKMGGHEPGGLAKLANTHLGITLDKHWTIRASDWEASKLTKRQIKYAAYDAYVSIRIFKKLIDSYEKTWNTDCVNCDLYMDVPFKAKTVNCNDNKPGTGRKCVKETKYSASGRYKRLEQNGIILTADGEFLGSCYDKKAQWYINKELADKVKDNPFTIKLRFEPTSRLYQLGEKKCVVCGKSDAYVRKNIVPREYRKYFPEIMKEHTSLDVVWLCTQCHQRINDSDLRMHLATQCNAPLYQDTIKYKENPDLKSLRSAACALMNDYSKHKLPVERRIQLENRIFKNFPNCQEITLDMLSEAMNIQVLYENENYESHGSKVVEYFIHKEDGGLLTLEKVWREHFLKTMQPRYMPDLWSVHHSEKRLLIQVRKGQIDPADIKKIGLKIKWHDTSTMSAELA